MKLYTDNLVKIYKGRRVVNGVSIEVNQGEIVGLLGPNGAGKTTSFYQIVGFIEPDEGAVYLDVKYVDREIARSAGARWDSTNRLWYVPMELRVVCPVCEMKTEVRADNALAAVLQKLHVFAITKK